MKLTSADARHLAAAIADLQQQVDALSRTAGLPYSSIDDGSLDVIDDTGTVRQVIGAQPDGTYTSVDLNGPKPPRPTAPIVEGHPGGITVRWDGRFTDGTSTDLDPPADFDHVEVHIGTDPGYVPNDYTQVGTMRSTKGETLTLALPVDEFWVTLQSVSTSKVESDPSTQVAGYPQPQGFVSDGAPPASSPAPTVTGGIGALYVRWSGITNETQVTYEVHVSTASGFTPSAATKVTETTATSATVRTLADGTPVTTGPEATPVVYYVRIVARDEDAAAAASAEGSGSLFRVGVEEISARYAYFGDITFDQITGGTMDADAVIAGRFTTSASGVGQRVEFQGTGVTGYAPDGSVWFDLPAAGVGSDRKPTIRGEAEFDAATFNDKVTIRGTQNEVSAQSSVTLSAGVGAPLSGPSMTAVYNAASYLTAAAAISASNYTIVGWARENGRGMIVANDVNGRGYTFMVDEASGTVTATGGPLQGRVLGVAPSNAGGFTVLFLTTVSGVPAFTVGKVYAIRYDPSGAISGTSAALHTVSDLTTPMCAGLDATNDRIVLVDRYSATILRAQFFAHPAASTTGQALPQLSVRYLTCSTGAAVRLGSAAHGAFDGAGANPMTQVVVDQTVRSWSTGSAGTSTNAPAAEYGSYQFPRAPQASLAMCAYNRSGSTLTYTGYRGLYPDGTSYIAYSDSLYLSADGGTAIWGAIAWYNTTSGKTSKIGPLRNITPPSRSGMRLTSPAIPKGNPSSPGYVAGDNPNAVRFFVGKGAPSSPPANGALWLQPDANPNDTTVDVIALTTSGTSAPGTGTFPLSAGGTLISAANRSDGRPKTQIGGDGFARLDGLILPGLIVPFAGAVPSGTDYNGWLLCDGAAVNRLIYADLFAVLSTNYGIGDGSATFNLPDFRIRFPLGAAASTGYTLGAKGGSSSHSLTIDNIPRHSHAIDHQHASTDQNGAHTHPQQFSDATGAGTANVPKGQATNTGQNRSPIGSDGSHQHTIPYFTGTSGDAGTTVPATISHLNPYQVVNYLIKW